MGAFFLYKKDQIIDNSKIKTQFQQRGFDNPNEFDLGSYSLLLYKKIGREFKNFRHLENYSLFVVGTLFYKSNDYENSLDLLIHDYKYDKIEYSALVGSFFVILRNKKDLYFFTDRAGIQDIYHTSSGDIISSSFLAIVESFNTLTLNLNAISEVLLTGNLIRPDTFFNEIKRFMVQKPKSFKEITQLDGISYKIYPSTFNNFRINLENQIRILKNYFDELKRISNGLGLSIGITGGLDSRILLILMRDKLDNYQIFSTFKKTKTEELKVAETICKSLNEKLICDTVQFPEEINSDELYEIIKKNFLFYDGQIRTHHLLWEEINSLDYRINLLREKTITMNGVGGEQYRNSERIIFNMRSLEKWIKYELIYKNAGEIIFDNHFTLNLIDSLKKKISVLLELENDKITKLDIKRYYNEIYNTSNRTLRANIENQIGFFLCPFTEYNVSFPAYEIINNLGLSKNFEIAMINKLDPFVANIYTDYGFIPSKGEPIGSILQTYIKEFVPAKLFYQTYRKRKSKTNSIQNLTSTDSKFEELVKYTKSLELPIKFDDLTSNVFLGPLTLFVGYFIKNYENKIAK